MIGDALLSQVFEIVPPFPCSPPGEFVPDRTTPFELKQGLSDARYSPGEHRWLALFYVFNPNSAIWSPRRYRYLEPSLGKNEVGNLLSLS